MLSAAARALKRRNGRPSLPALLFFTDPARVPDLRAAVGRLPPGAGVVYRHFGAADRHQAAQRLFALCRRRRLKLLIGADWRLAARIGADGVHLPQKLADMAAPLRKAHRAWLITVAAHGPIRRNGAADAAVLAPVLPSASPSAKRPLGARRADAIAGRANLPVYALGGINRKTISRLWRFAGIAAVEALL